MPAIREELVTSAISFLQDPSVASAPLDKKVAFLESKNLTKQEVDAALARTADPNASTASAPSQAVAAAPTQQYYARSAPPQQQQQYGGYPGYWPEPPKPELPKRDWRDWFIMATVLGGVGYGLYFTAKRYIIPKIAPPTPDQLTKDKAAVDADFQKAFALLEQLSTDTDALKSAEESRTHRLDTALTELETVLGGLKEADRKREDDAKRNTDEIRSLRDLIPQALDQQKRSTEERLKDLGSELRSLKTLVGNRMQAPPPAPAAQPQPASMPASVPAATAAPAPSPAPAPAVRSPSTNGINGASNYQPPSVANGTTPRNSIHKTTTSSGSNGVNGSVPGINTAGRASPAPASPAKVDAPIATPAVEANSAAPERPMSSFGSRFGSGKAAIPAWQMAAAKKAAEGEEKKVDTPAVEAEAGAA